MTRILATLTLLAGTATVAFGLVTPVPEIDANSAVAAIALVSGALLLIRGRRKN